jgi:hypothetical protein
MHAQASAPRRAPLFVAAALLSLAAGGCGFGPLPGRATEEWTRTYPLSPGGEVRIGNTNGKVEIEGVDGSTVEVRAEKIARAATDEGARQLLPKVTIIEDTKPDRVSIETGRISGMLIGARYEVDYHVRAPKTALITARTTNGVVTLSGLTGKVVARTTNGGVRATDLRGPVDASSTNGAVSVDLASVGADRIALSTTNGGVTLNVPDTAKADVVATWTNGGMNVDGLNVDVSERSRRRFEGKLNGGGTPIELHTTNGGIRLRARDGEAQRTEK